MKIDIKNDQNIIKINKKLITEIAVVVLTEHNETNSELSILFVDDIYIKRLNAQYRDIDKATDVLAFPIREGMDIAKDFPILGDVVISTETTVRESKKRKKDLKEELGLYLIHGILHLLGYKDDNVKNANKMKKKQQQLMRRLF